MIIERYNHDQSLAAVSKNAICHDLPGSLDRTGSNRLSDDYNHLRNFEERYLNEATAEVAANGPGLKREPQSSEDSESDSTDSCSTCGSGCSSCESEDEDDGSRPASEEKKKARKSSGEGSSDQPPKKSVS